MKIKDYIQGLILMILPGSISIITIIEHLTPVFQFMCLLLTFVISCIIARNWHLKNKRLRQDIELNKRLFPDEDY